MATAMATATGHRVKSRRPDGLHRRPSLTVRSLLRRVDRAARPGIVAVLGMAALGAVAQEAEPRPGLFVEPSLGLRETGTDNVHLSNADRRSDLVTELTPQIRLNSRSSPSR